MKTTQRRLLVALAALLLIAAVWAGLAALRPLPDRTFTLATGPVGSAYEAYGRRYQALLARSGVEVKLVATAGTYENVEKMLDPKAGVSAGFIQAGSVTEDGAPGLLSLGTMFYEPLWVFCRCEPDDLDFHERLGRRVSIGPDGGATRALVLRIFKMNGIDPARFELLGYAPEKAADELIAGRIDAAIIDTAWESPAVQKLMADRSIHLVGYPRADAYVALMPFLSKVVLPEGVASLAENRPPKDVVLIAPKASLAVREDLHPALQYLLIDAAQRIHGGPGVFNAAGTFPAPEMIDLPLSAEAQHMYRSGPSFLRRHLPFWLAELGQRLLLVVIPLVGLIYPVTKLVPEAWRWEMGRRLQRAYRDLRSIERGLIDTAPGPERAEWHARLDELEARVQALRLPDSYAAPAYELKQNIRFVQERHSR
ncbi:MAG: TAXI family TRAP transporter solute-binding subunit [Steroidobacteraceae bacterium]